MFSMLDTPLHACTCLGALHSGGGFVARLEERFRHALMGMLMQGG